MSDPFPTTHTPETVALVLAGGKGSRLSPLTDARSKPSVRFGGSYQIIDVALSNLAHSRLRDVWVVEQYTAPSLSTSTSPTDAPGIWTAPATACVSYRPPKDAMRTALPKVTGTPSTNRFHCSKATTQTP